MSETASPVVASVPEKKSNVTKPEQDKVSVYFAVELQGLHAADGALLCFQRWPWHSLTGLIPFRGITPLLV